MSDVPATAQDEAKSALARDWLIARVVLIGGFVVAIAAVVWFGWIEPSMQRQEAIEKLQQQLRANSQAAAQLCQSGLGAAQDFGIVPSYGHLFGNKVYRTNVQGRYICVAATHATKYLVAVDLFCRNLKDKRCVSLYSVIQGDGKILYQRQT